MSDAYQAQLDAAGAALVAGVNWAEVSSRLVSRLQRPGKLQRSLDTPMRQRTALDAAHCALARLIADGTFK